MKIVAVSGGFDPLHIGHVQLMEKAKNLGDKLVVILNNDHWVKKKKGYVFMNEMERKGVIEAVRWVDEVVISSHPENPEDMSISKDLEKLRPNIFANGGDRNEQDAANPKSSLYADIQMCRKIGTEMVFNLGDKVQSSSWLLNKIKGLDVGQ